MAFTTQFGKSTTLSADMSDSETSSATLASAAFTNFSADYLVLDANVPAKREVIKCTVTGTAISSITRAQQGTSAVAHSSGALVVYGFLPAHYEAAKSAFAAGSFASHSSTGNKAVTGVGFKPKLVKFFLSISAQGTNASGLDIVEAEGRMTASAQSCNNWAIRTNATVGSNGQSTSTCIKAVDYTGAHSYAASFVSMDSDGFTVNVTAADASYTVYWEAYGDNAT